MSDKGMISKLLPLILLYVRSGISWNQDFFKGIDDRRRYNTYRKERKLDLFPEPQEVLEAPYCFVLSTGRSGTALLTKILEGSSRLLVQHNPKPKLEWVSSLVHRDQPSVDCLRLAVLASRFDNFFLDSFVRDKIYVETNNRISLFAPALADLLPNAKFVHLVRNPADFVRSGMRRGYYAKGITQHQRLQPENKEGWSCMSRLEKIAWEWNEINQSIESFKNTISGDKVMTIKSESLFKGDKNEIISEIFDFLGVKNPYSTSQGQRRLRKIFVNPVNKQKDGGFKKFGDWSSEDKIALRAIATLAPIYGYRLQDDDGA